MSEQKPTEYTTADHHPIAIDAWAPSRKIVDDKDGTRTTLGPSSYLRAINVIEGSANRLQDNAMYSLASRALMATIADQSDRNSHEYISSEIRERYATEIAGDSSPAAMIQMLHEHPAFGAVEIARKTHVAQWDTQSVIDTPVRDSIDSGVAQTRREKSDPKYKIKMFDENGVMVERKRIIRTHYNGEIMTIIRNCLLLDYASADMPLRLKRKMRAEHKTVADRDKDYDYSEESTALRDALEAYVGMRGTSIDGGMQDKPEWAIPLLTTYYSTRADKLKIAPTLSADSDTI
ncbi:MAG: hypothetical protein EOO17_01705 [Chloroflexi bacterium]|nr:MAG: hypothetical protein EOO17_01705 [Chloroflexota bacterium]